MALCPCVLSNTSKNDFGIEQYLNVRESKNGVPIPFQLVLPPSVEVLLLVVNASIHFHNEPMIGTVEIHDE